VPTPAAKRPCTREALSGASADQVRLPVASLQHSGEMAEWYIVRGRELRAVQPRGIEPQDDPLVGVHREGTITRGLGEVKGRLYLRVAELAQALDGSERLGIDWIGSQTDWRVAPRSDHLGRGDQFFVPQDDAMPVVHIRSERCGMLCLASVQDPDLVRVNPRAASHLVVPVSGADDPNRSPNAPRTQGEQP